MCRNTYVHKAINFYLTKKKLGKNPFAHRGWGAPPSPPLFLSPLLKILLGIPYLKILHLTKHFIAAAHMKKKKSKNLVLPPLRALLGHHLQTYLLLFCFYKKNLLKPRVGIILDF